MAGTSAQFHAPCLLDLRAYISDCKNATTASCDAEAGWQIRVTFVVSPPPGVSHLCVFCPGLPASTFAVEPEVVATEANLVLLRVVFGPYSNANRTKKHHFFVYQAADGDRAPSLRQIPHPKPFVFFENNQVGLLPRYKEHPGLYYIAALPSRSRCLNLSDVATASQMHFYLYNSQTNSWSTKQTASLEDGQDVDLRRFHCSKVIAIGGGEGGVVAWVDLWQGLLHCNVLSGIPKLRYTLLPPPLQPKNELSGSPWLTRDIAVIQGRIRYVELDVRTQGLDLNGEYVADGWMAVAWTRTAATPWYEDKWRKDFSVDSDTLSADPVLLDLLPKLHDHRGRPQPTLQWLHTGHPTLSLLGDPVVYIMTKVKDFDDSAWVLAVDMTEKGSLKAVVPFGAERTFGISFSYVHSRVSEYLNFDPESSRHGRSKAEEPEEKEEEGEAERQKARAWPCCWANWRAGVGFLLTGG